VGFEYRDLKNEIWRLIEQPAPGVRVAPLRDAVLFVTGHDRRGSAPGGSAPRRCPARDFPGAYLLAGIFFGVLYHAVESVWPGSFAAAGAIKEFPLFDAIYFSFVTLATLGYGDLVPVSGVARGLAVVEAVSGQLFLAVMIARLVSTYEQTMDGRKR
jgi:hypothetical protein